MNLKKIAESLDLKCRPNLSIAGTLTDSALKRVLLYRAQINDSRWPFNSVRAHRYALRMIRRMDLGCQFEFCEAYDSLMSQYVNDLNNQ